MNNRSMCRNATVFAVFTLLILTPIIPLPSGITISILRIKSVDVADSTYNYFAPEDPNSNQETLINNPYPTRGKAADMSEQSRFGTLNLGLGCDGYILFTPWLSTKTYLESKYVSN